MNETVTSTPTKSSAEYAYLQIFDANDQLERRTLIKHILTDSRISMLFLLNCAQDRNEIDQAFLKIVKDPQKCYELLKNKIDSLSSVQRTISLETVLLDSKIAWDTAWNANLTLNEKKLIFQTHKNTYLAEETIDNYWIQWNLFGELMDTGSINKLINMIYKDDSYEVMDMAESLLMYCKTLTQDQRDLLDGHLVATALRSNYRRY